MRQFVDMDEEKQIINSRNFFLYVSENYCLNNYTFRHVAKKIRREKPDRELTDIMIMFYYFSRLKNEYLLNKYVYGLPREFWEMICNLMVLGSFPTNKILMKKLLERFIPWKLTLHWSSLGTLFMPDVNSY